MSTADSLLAALTRLTGPLGPFTTPAQRRADEKRLLAGLDAGALDDLLDLAERPPGHDRPDLEPLLREAVAAAGRHAPRRAIERVVPMLDDSTLRPFAVDVLGSLGHGDAVAFLDHLVRRTALTDDELERVACSLGEIGGPQAVVVLTRLRTPAAPASVTREIDIALQQMRHRREPHDDREPS